MAASNAAGHYSQSYLLSTDRGSGSALRISPLEPLQQKNASDRRKLHLRRHMRFYGITVQSRAGFLRGTVKLKDDEEITDVTESEPSSGTKKISNLPGILATNNQSLARDNKLVFVAGATGKVGSRTVRELVKLGFRVRASTRNKEKAGVFFENILQDVSFEEESKPSGPFSIFSPANLFGFLKPKAGKQVDIIECDLESRESIEAALGNAGVVVCCIGASEKEVLDVTGPFRIDYKATKNLIDAASEAQVNHFVLLTSLGTQKFGFPAAVLNLFWGVLVWKAKAEKALIESGIPYTIVRPGGMERPTDAYKETHNLRLAEADTLFGGQVSNLQVAELIASVVGSFELSKNKILEVVAETTAPLRPIRELLEEIPSLEEETSKLEKRSMKKVGQKSGGIDAQKIFKKLEEEKPTDQKKLQAKQEEEKRKEAKRLEEEKRLQLQKAEEEKRKLEALRTKYEKEILAAKEKEEEAKTAAKAALAEKFELEKRTAETRAKAEAAALAARQAKALEAAVLAAAQKGQVLSELEKEKILDAVKLEAQMITASLKESKAQSQKTTGIPFFGRFPSSKATETSTDDSKIDTTESQDAQEEEKATVKSRLQSAKLAEKKLQEQKKKEAEALKLEEQEAARIAAAKKKEEQEKAELEAKRLAEQEAARIAAAKKKEEQEKAELEAKRLAEQEAASTAEIKREEEEKEALVEAKISTEKETKPKPEEAAEEKVEVVEKKAAETIEVDKAKVDTENIAKENTEATSSDSTDAGKDAPGKTAAPAMEPGKGFGWFWQPAVQEDIVPEATVATASPSSEVNPDVTVETETSTLSPSLTPLSPYTRFPELKPPIPSPSAVSTDSESSGVEVDAAASETSLPKDATAEKDTDVSAEQPAKETSDEAERKKLVLETMAREKEALERAKSATSFLWPWQKPKRTIEEPAETSPSANLTTEGESLSPISEETSKQVLQSSSTSMVSNEVTKDVPETLPASTRPLSPYAMYPGLRPPTSPTPSPPSPWAKTGTVTPSKAESANFEDKQVTSKESLEDDKAEKSEEAKGRMTEEDEESKRLLAKEVAEREREALDKAKAATTFTWPWQKPEAEKQSVEKVAITESNKEETAPPTRVLVAGPQTLPPSSRPLSPYTQFPNLKPPTSPTPSPPSKPIQSEPKATVPQETSTPLSPYSVFPDLKPPGAPTPLTDNGAVVEEPMVKEESATSNAGFKWPWQ